MKEIGMSNEPKILIEFTSEEIKFLADRLHEEWARTVQAKAIVTDAAAHIVVEEHQKMASKLMNCLVDKASDQGFGDL